MLPSSPSPTTTRYTKTKQRLTTHFGFHLNDDNEGRLPIRDAPLVFSDMFLQVCLLLLFSLPGTHTSLLWANRPWVSTSPTSTYEWTRWLTCCTTLRNRWSPPDPWSTCASESCPQVTHTCTVRLITFKESCPQNCAKHSLDDRRYENEMYKAVEKCTSAHYFLIKTGESPYLT